MTEMALSTAVIRAVADRERVDPTALEEPLYAAIDGDALDRLFARGEGSVTFDYYGYEVTASSDGDVTLEPLAE